ncbi:MAG: hypothetical protein C0454_09175 [Parvibaculum sp.]|jgi:hypothetical protein|nr:hypothetical protein [Parvibaculum sp.]
MRKSYIQAEAVPDAGNLTETGLRLRNSQGQDALADADDEAVAAYLLDLMIASRRVAAKRGFSFLAYLIGVAAEESRLLSLGRSAVRKQPAGD